MKSIVAHAFGEPDVLRLEEVPAPVAGPGQVRVNKAGCLDRCAGAPVAVVYPEGTWYTFVDQSDIDEIVERAEGEIEQVDIATHVARKKTRSEGEATRHAIDRCPRLGEKRRDLWRRRLGIHLIDSPSSVTVFPVAAAPGRAVE